MRARRLFATVALAVGSLLMSGCAAPIERSPVFDLFRGEQQPADRLPSELDTWSNVLHGTSRLLGSVEGYRYYVVLQSLSFEQPFCVAVTDVVGALTMFSCGSDTITVEMQQGPGFVFTEEPQEVSHGPAWLLLNPHFQVSTPPYYTEMPYIPIFDTEQDVGDLLAEDAWALDVVVPESTRYLGEYAGTRFYLGRSSQPDAHFCVMMAFPEDRQPMWACGGPAFGLTGPDGQPTVEFLAVGYPPDHNRPGWTQVGDHLLVQDAPDGG